MDEPPDIKLWVAYIAAGASLISVLINVLLARSSERKRREHEARMAAQKEQHDKVIEKLRSELAAQSKQIEARLSDQSSERNARRDYEYEARKRLYTEVEPVLFQFSELAEAALHRIFSLARSARNGNLSDPHTSWLGEEQSYYFRSTLYNLLAPLAAVKLLQRRITFVDLSVERSITSEYALAKRLLISFTDDFEFARYANALKYDPNSDELATSRGARLRQRFPEVYWRQGVFIGFVEGCAESFLVTDADGRPVRVKSFSAFEAERDKADSPTAKALGEVNYLLMGFHPKRRPIFWRMLVTQACIYRTFVELREAKLAGRTVGTKPLRLIPKAERSQLDWRSQKGEASDSEVLEMPFVVAEQYLSNHVPDLIDLTEP